MTENDVSVSAFLKQQIQSIRTQPKKTVAITPKVSTCSEPCNAQVPFQVEFLLQNPFQLPTNPPPTPVFTFDTSCLHCTSDFCIVETAVQSPCNNDALPATTTIQQIRVVGNLSFLVSLGPILTPGGIGMGASLSQFGQVCINQPICYVSQDAPLPCLDLTQVEVDPKSIQIKTASSPGGNTLIQLTGVFVLPDCEKDSSQPLLYVTKLGLQEVSAIEAGTGDVVNTIIVGDSPSHIIFTPDQNHAYVQNFGGNETSVIDLNSNTVVATVPVPSPAFAAVTPDGSHVYISSPNDDLVSVVETASNTVIDTISVSAPFGIAVTPNGTHVYVTDIDTASSMIVDQITVGNFPAHVAITPDGTHAYVTNFNVDADNNHTVSVIETASQTVVETIIVGDSPSFIAITPNGSHAYIANTLDGTVSIIEIATNTVVETLITGESFGLAISPDGTRAYVTAVFDNEIHVINTAIQMIITTFPADAGPAGIAVK